MKNSITTRKTAMKASVGATLVAVLAFFMNSSALLAQSSELGADAFNPQPSQVDSVPSAPQLNSGADVSTNEQTTPADVFALSQELAPVDPVVFQKGLKRMQFLDRVKGQVNISQRDFIDATKAASEADQQLAVVQIQATTLSDQLRYLDEQIENTAKLIANVKMQIAEKENSISDLSDQIDLQKIAIDSQKQMLLDYLSVIYEQENSINNTADGKNKLNVVKLLFSDTGVAEQLQEMKYFNILETKGHELFDKLETLLKKQQDSQTELESQKVKLALLYANLADQKQAQDTERDARVNLLIETKGQEAIFQQLVEESKKQQAQAQEDLRILRQNYDFIQQKIYELGDSFNPENYQNMFDGNTAAIADFINATKNDPSAFILEWPVSPSRGISAYFHDPSYLGAFGVQHQAIDIRATQGSLIQAPADGVVYKVRDNGYGYSYIILAHAGGYMTVYGHVSEFRVKPGEQVMAGQIIGLTGGTPGTKGAGAMTTGAHLHFEVMKGGKYVDPLNFLPLSLLPVEGMPSEFINKITGEKTKIRRVGTDGQPVYSGDEATKIIESNAKIEELYGNAISNSGVTNSETP